MKRRSKLFGTNYSLNHVSQIWLCCINSQHHSIWKQTHPSRPQSEWFSVGCAHKSGIQLWAECSSEIKFSSQTPTCWYLLRHHFKCQSSEFKQWGCRVDVKKTPRTRGGMFTSTEVEGEEKGKYNSLKQRFSQCHSTSYENGRRRRWVQCLAFSIHHLKVRSSVQMNTFLQISVWKRGSGGGRMESGCFRAEKKIGTTWEKKLSTT